MADPMNDQNMMMDQQQPQPQAQPKSQIDASKFIKKVLKKNNNTGELDPSKSAKDALKTITSLTHTIDISNIVDKVLQRRDYSISKQVSWPDVLTYLEKDEKKRNDKTDELIDNLVSEDVTGNINNRKFRYREYRSSIKKLPILNKLLRIYTSNVLSPDDITKISVRIVPVDTILEDDEAIKNIIGKYTVILDKINLEKYVSETVYNTFFMGDYFIEVQSSKRSLIQTLYNLQIPVIESLNTIKDSSDKNINTTYTKKIVGDNNKAPLINKKNKIISSVGLTIQESLPITDQIENTSNTIHKIVNELFNVPVKGVLTESIIQEKLQDNIALQNTVKILRDQFILNEDDKLSFNIDTTNNDSNYNSKVNTNNNIKKLDDIVNLKHAIDILPTEASLSNIMLKTIDVDQIVVLEKNGVCYGYLHVLGLSDLANSTVGTRNISSLSNNVTNGLDSERITNNSIVTNFIKSLNDYFKEKFGEINDDGSMVFNINDMAPGLQQLISDILISNNDDANINIRYIPPSNIQHFKRSGSGTYYPYGESLLDDLMFTARLLLADNISSTINKISKVGKRMMFTVKGNTQQQAFNNIMDVKNAVSKNIVTLDKMGSMDTIPSAINSQKNFFIPEVNGEKQMEIDSLDMGSYQDQADPGNIMLKQLISSADVPPPFLGFDEFTNSKANLTSENVVFAQNIINAQKEFAEQFTELMQKIYLALYLKTKNFDITYKQVRFTFNAPRSIMLNIFAENLNYLSSIIDALTKLKIPNDKIIERYFPELITFDLKLTQTVNALSTSKNDNNNNMMDNGGYAPFDAGDMFGQSIDTGGASPPPNSPAQSSNPDDILNNLGMR